MNKLQILIITLLISLSICAFSNMQVKAQITGVSVSASAIDKGFQTSILTAAIPGGTYTYQWKMVAPGQSTFTDIPGAAQINYTFAPSSSATVGNYQFFVVASGLFVSNIVSVMVNDLPTISVTPFSWIMDIGQSKTFTANASGGTGTLSYQWYLTGSAVSGQTGLTYSFTASTAGSPTIYCEVKDHASSPVVVQSNVVSVSVSPALVAPTVTAASGTVNQGQSCSLSSSVVSTGTSPYSYQWLSRVPGVGSYSLVSGATLSSYSFVTSGSTATGTWSFELQITDAASSVVTSNAVSVVVNAVPTVVLSPTSWTMDVGQNKTFTATASGGSGSYTSYQWYVGGVAQLDAASTFTYTPSSAGSYSITATVTDSFGTTSVLSSAASVTVAASPSVSIVPVGPVKMDVGQVQVFSASGSGGSGSLSYQWFLDGVVVGGNSASYSYTAAGVSHSVTCKVTDSASVSVTSGVSNVVSVSVSPALVAPTVTAASGTVNQGQSCSLSSSVVSTGTSPYSYQWLSRAPGVGSYSLVSGATLSSYSFATSIVTATGNWNFLLQVKDNAGAVVNSSAASVTVNIPPLDHFVFSSVGTQTAGTSFSITIMAKDVSNNTLTNYVGTNVLNVSIGTINPTGTGVFVSGVWTGSVTLIGANSGVTLFTTGSGMSGTSNSFNVNSGALNRFTFNTVSSQQTSGVGFSITVTAKDAYENIVTGYTGSPSLTVSVGSISPITMNAFVNGVGSTTVTVTGESSGVTIMVADNVYSGISNSFALAISTTPTPSPTQAPISTSTPTATPTATPTTTSKPSPSPTPLETTVKAKTYSGGTVNLGISGSITSSQMSNVKITINKSDNSTAVSMTVSGESGTIGFSNITIPKTAITFGTTPVVFLDDQQAPNQGYTQDSQNFYVWYTTHFSTHQMKIQFAGSLVTQTSSFAPLIAVAIIAPEIVLVYTIIAVRRLRRRPENT